MAILDIQPEDVPAIVEVSFEDVGPNSAWNTRHWNSEECQQNKLEFIHDLESAIQEHFGEKVNLDDLLSNENPNAFFDAAALKMAATGFYVYNSDNFFEVYLAKDVESAFDEDELQDMLAEHQAYESTLPSPFI